MAPRQSHLPHSNERVALQRLRSGQRLSATMLHPAGRTTIEKMLGKGWIRTSDSRYEITPAGLAALQAQIPTPSRAGRRLKTKQQPDGIDEI